MLSKGGISKQKSVKDVFYVLKRIHCFLLILVLAVVMAASSALAETSRMEIIWLQ